MTDGGAVFHDRPDVDQVLAVLVHGAAQQPHEGLVGQDALRDGVDQEPGVDQRLAGALAPDGALGQLHERFAARGLAADAPLDLAHEQEGVLDGGLPEGQRQVKDLPSAEAGSGLYQKNDGP